MSLLSKVSHRFVVCVSCLCFVSVDAIEGSQKRISMLYNSLDPYSASQHLAFYELYSDQPIGQRALQDSWRLLSGSSHSSSVAFNDVAFSASTIESIVALVNKQTDQELPLINQEDLRSIEKLASRLAHVNLKGHQAASEADVLALPPREIDLARGLFINQFGSDERKIKSYEAMIDLMALQILAYLPAQATPEMKIRAINRFVFEEMGFRFPPHSLYAKDIDVYTFLPSVLDSHRGVCLGVSILYLCLAQRLALPLEMITPPGHIYIRYQSPKATINIETTARGIHLDSEEYLSVETRSLQQRTIKEVIGLARFNQAALFLQQGDYQQALTAYQQAEPYLKDDCLLKELMGYAYILNGDSFAGEKLLQEIKGHVPDDQIAKDAMAEDYLDGHANADCLKAVFKHVDEDRQSILAKKNQLEKIVQQHPRFRAGLFHLAVTWLQLHRAGEALEALRRYHQLDPHDPEANYYLAALYAQRLDYNQAWAHLQKAEAYVNAHGHDPKSLKELRRSLTLCCPE